jgi:hypothetical protein
MTQFDQKGILKQLIEEMKNDPWHVRLRRWFRLQRWVWMCRTRGFGTRIMNTIYSKRNDEN